MKYLFRSYLQIILYLKYILMPLPVAPLTEPSPAKSFLKLLPVEIQAEILSYLDEESFFVLCTTCRNFVNANYFYEKRLLDNYGVRGTKRVEMGEEHKLKNILTDYLTYKMHVVYAQAKDFQLLSERESFLYVKELQGDTPFVWDMFHDVAYLGNSDLLLDLLKRYQLQEGSEDISFRFDMQILDNAVKSRNIHFLATLFDHLFSLPINDITLARAAKSGNIKLMRALVDRLSIKQQKKAITFGVLKGAVLSGNRKLVEWVIQHIGRRAPRGDNKQTRELVMAAASMLHIDLMDYLITRYSVQITNTQMGYILSAVAAAGGDVETVNRIQRTYPTEPLSQNRIRALILSAARGGCIDLLNDLREKYSQVYSDMQYIDVLDTLAEYRHADLFKLFIQEFSATSNTTYPNLTAILHIAARGSLKLVQSLCETYPIELANYHMEQLIKPAARSGDIKLVEWLVREYPDSLTQDTMKDVLLQAAYSENIYIFKLLMEAYSRLFTIDQEMLQKIFVSLSGKAKVGFVILFYKEYATHLTINKDVIGESEHEKNYHVNDWLCYVKRFQESQRNIVPIRFAR